MNNALLPYTALLLPEPARNREEPWLRIAGRLKSGHSRGELQAALQVVSARQDRLHAGRVTRINVTNGSIIARSDSRQRFAFSFNWLAGWRCRPEDPF